MKFPAKVVLVATVLAVTASTVFIGYGPYVQWRLRRLVVTARALLNQGDARSASLTARAVLQKDANNLDACAVLAQIAEADHSPSVVLWREKLANLQPGNTHALLDLAAAATRLGETFVAENALNRIRTPDRNTVAYHQAVVAWLMSLHQWDAAEREAEAALALDSTNVSLRLNVAALRLAISSPAGSDGPRAELEALQNYPSARLEATRDLLADARRRNDAAKALQLAAELGASPSSGLGDRLLYLEELQHARNPEFEARLAALLVGQTDAGAVYAIMEWLNIHGLSAKTLEWDAALPAPIRTQNLEQLAVADACALLGEWRRLSVLVRNENWGDLEFVRLAYDARALDGASEHAHGSEFAGRWEHAMVSTRGNPNAIAMLARLVQGWGWKKETAQLWWLLANRKIGQRPALAALFEMSMEEKNTRELYRISRRICEIEPTNAVAKNNVAMFALLLGEDLDRANTIAEENLRTAPDNSGLLSTWAFSLFRQKRFKEGLDVMARMPPAALNDPSIAACYGALLAASGEADKARPFLDSAVREKTRLFPEEIAYVERAREVSSR